MEELEHQEPDTRNEELKWLREEVEKSKLFTDFEKKFIANELQVNKAGNGFTAAEKHLKSLTFGGHINWKLKKLPAFGKRTLQGIYHHPSGAYLELRWKPLQVIDSPKHSTDHPAIFVEEHDDHYAILKALIQALPASEPVKEVWLIQHWGDSSTDLRNFILDHTEARIYLYIQNPKKGCCPDQKNKIRRFRDVDFLTHLPADQEKRKRVTLYQFDVPASIRAVLVDNRYLAFGVYVYYAGKKLDGEIDLRRKTDLKGQTLPVIYASRDWSEFSKLKRVIDFWFENVKADCQQIYPLLKDHSHLNSGRPKRRSNHPRKRPNM